MGKVVPFRTHCPFTSLPLSYSPVSLRRDLLNPLQRQQYMKFCMFTHLLHRLATSGSIPKVIACFHRWKDGWRCCRCCIGRRRPLG